MRVAFVTVGDTNRMTGGYLYNNRVFNGLRERGVKVEEFAAGGASPAEQRAAASRLASMFDPSPFDVIVVDALARIAIAAHLDRWRVSHPVVALVHELPSIANHSAASGDVACEQEYEEPLLRADRLITVSSHGQALLEARDVPPERVHIVPPGFDRLPPMGVSGAPRREDVAVCALCVAQWIPRKGILTLIEAWTRHKRSNATLLLIGETNADRNYAVAVHDAIDGATGFSIRVAGSVEDSVLAASYATADVFVLPSHYESYGIVYAEALAAGLPVVACEVGPVPGLVGPEAALLVPPGDVGALSEALDLLLGDPVLRDRMSVAARRRAANLPRWENTVTGFHEVLKQALS